MADNGPMEAIHPETGQNGFFRGGKNDVTGGGIRVPAFAYWPGVIEPGTVVGDIVHVSDLFNTFARIAGRYDQIPRDRIIDGIDQTALFLQAVTPTGGATTCSPTRGPMMGSIVKQQFKRLLPIGPGALRGCRVLRSLQGPP